MKCPACHSTEHLVLSTRPGDSEVRRTRECGACRHRWFTTELYAESLTVMETAVKAVQSFRAMTQELDHGAPAHR